MIRSDGRRLSEGSLRVESRYLVKNADSDETLMLRVRRGDASAFEILHDRHRTAVFWLAMRILDDRGLAADVTQETFMALWLNRDKYRPDRGRLRWWLQSIVRNRAIDLRRRAHDDVPRTPPPFELTPAPDSTEEEVLAGESRRELAALIDHLPAEQRTVIELAFYSGLTHAEITERLGVPLGTTKSRIRIALERLRLSLPHDEKHTSTG
jgi:RNA polymerase sigma-70 factor (ECF subfamily)